MKKLVGCLVSLAVLAIVGFVLLAMFGGSLSQDFGSLQPHMHGLRPKRRC